MIGDLHPLAALAASGHADATRWWDLDPLPQAPLGRRWNDELVYVVYV
jgi:hypothetical protein